MDCIVKDVLWSDYSDFSVTGISMGRRSSMVRNSEGKLLVFSPLEANVKRIEAMLHIGSPVAFILQNRFHDCFFESYFEKFPEALFFGNKSIYGGPSGLAFGRP